MAPPEESSVWAPILVGAAGNLLGGAAVTGLWWLVTQRQEKAREQRGRLQKSRAIALEVAKILAWLRLLREDAARASAVPPGGRTGTLAALVRLGPEIVTTSSLEPLLGEAEHRLGMVEAAASRLFASTAGAIASAMRGNEEELEELRASLSREAAAAELAVKALEAAVVSPNE